MNLIHDARSIFDYMKHQNIDWWQAIAELIDNSLDAGALRIEIAISTNALEISDDGKGCGNLERMLALGSHVDHGTSEQPVGMWGVGLKDAWTFCGDRIEVESVHRGVLSTASVSLSDIKDDGEAPDPVCTETTRSQGTIIRMPLKKGRRPPQQPTWDRIEWVFTPAIHAQKQIVITRTGRKRSILKPVPLPLFTKSVQESFDIDGKAVTINIGIVKDGHKMKSGPFWLSYGHRNILDSSIGANGWCTIRMGGTIALGKGWVLKKNKDDLSELKDELEEAIFERIRPLLEEHSQLAQDIEANELRHELESLLNDSISGVKREQRKPPTNHSGTVDPAFSGRKRRNASKTTDADGSVQAGEGKRRRGFRLNWMDNSESDAIGVYEVLTKEVRLNIGHPFIRQMKADGNLAALYACAVALLCHTETTQDKGNALLFEKKGPFHDNYGRVMRSIDTGNGGCDES